MAHSVPFLSLKEIHEPIIGELRESVGRVIDSGIYINGPEGRAFASELASLLGKGEVVPVSNGLDAIRLILRGYIETGRLKPGDEVILPANTYIASLLPVTEFGLQPVLVKPDPLTFGLDWHEAEKAVTPLTRAVITVHLYGTPSWDFGIASRLREKGILIIEDNAQAIGAAATDPATGVTLPTGALGDAAAFSFYPTKNVGALGDAGAVATTDAALARTVRALANYGSSERYHNDFTGYNCRMDEIQAAVLRVKLRHLNEITASRRKAAETYDSLLTAPEVRKPAFVSGSRQVWHQYVVRVPRRNEFRDFLASRGVATDVHYPLALVDQKCYSGPHAPRLLCFGDAAAEARRLSQEVLSLPIANPTTEEIKSIASLIHCFYEK